MCKNGENCIIGSGNIIKNTIIYKNVVIQDNCKIGQKGFGFVPSKGKILSFHNWKSNLRGKC